MLKLQFGVFPEIPKLFDEIVVELEILSSYLLSIK
jgi:hypothetical protein